MFSIYFTICAFFFNALLLVAYFFKKRVKRIENVFYSGMLISSFLGLLTEMFSAYLVLGLDISQDALIYQIAVKNVYALFLFWVSCLTVYYLALLRRHIDIKTNIFPSVLTVMCIINVIVMWLPLVTTEVNGIPLPLGPCVIVSDILACIYFVVIIALAIYNHKQLKIKEYVPIILTIILFFVDVFAQIYASLFISFSIYTFIAFVMFFIIENPDLKMLEEVKMAKEQAEKANKAKSDFLSSMSHEIRTPLNAIVGFSESLKEGNLDEKSKEEVNDIISASQTLLETVNGILDISKIEANKIEICESDYDFDKVFNELVTLSKARLGDSKPIEFIYNKAIDVPRYLHGDYARVKQVILNLLTNAIKYTTEGFVKFDVSCINSNGTCKLIIKVEDSGMGIKKESIDKLFNKFERLDNENSTIEGTGLGLAITKKLVELMNGRIIVNSTYGKGSQFAVILAQKIVTSPLIANANEKTNEIIHDLSNKKVLVVDDNRLNLKVTSKLLQKYNITTENVSSGDECLDLINKGNKYDVILLDDMMPKKTGKETFKELRSIPSFHTPVVMLTANAIEGMREEYLKEGFNDYLAKPIERDELNRVVKEFLDN